MLVAATLFISFTSFELYKESIPRLFPAEIVEYQNLSRAIAVLIVPMVIAALPLIPLFRQKTRGAAAILLGLLTLIMPDTMASTHTWRGINYPDAFNTSMTVIGIGLLLLGAGIFVSVIQT